ncbi:hypothetical protein CPC16_002584 [Podila verticillata]|nr:hypothetical protein CPC16_002584 [Podila verticillata]
MSNNTQKNHDPPRPPYPPSYGSAKHVPPTVGRCTCLFARLWHSHCADLTDARFEYETCVVSATCRQTKPKTPPANHRLQRLWFHATDRGQYIQELEQLIDDIEKYLEELTRQQQCRVQEVEDDERRHRQEIEIMKSRHLYGGRN